MRRGQVCAKFWRIVTEDGEHGSGEISYSTASSEYSNMILEKIEIFYRDNLKKLQDKNAQNAFCLFYVLFREK